MRYLLAVIADRNARVMADNGEMAAIDAFNDKIEAAGQRVIAVGVAAPDQARLFDNRDGRGHVENGPVIDSDLFMAGFWVIEVASEEEADLLAAEASRACNRLIERRQLLD